MTWVVWLDYKNKWHSSEMDVRHDSLANKGARQYASALAGYSKGTATYIGTAKAAFCIHAKSRYEAISMAKKAQKARLLKGGKPRTSFTIRPKGKKPKRVSFIARR